MFDTLQDLLMQFSQCLSQRNGDNSTLAQLKQAAADASAKIAKIDPALLDAKVRADQAVADAQALVDTSDASMVVILQHLSDEALKAIPQLHPAPPQPPFTPGS
jgi:ABC-type transporter Mla subunit MlaD